MTEEDGIAAPRSTATAMIEDGDALRIAGRFAEALARYDAAAQADPHCAPAHVRRGDILLASGYSEAAQNAYRQALGCDPHHAPAHFGLGALEMTRGRYAEALAPLARALERASTPAARTAFGQSAVRTRFTHNDPSVRAMLTSAVAEAWAMPHELCAAALSFIMLDARIAGCVRRANEHWPARAPRAVLFGESGLAALAADGLLHALLSAVPVKSIALERLMTSARHVLLESAATGESVAEDAAALDFYAALARQCFINEYVFDWSDAEQRLAARCRAMLLAQLDARQAVPPLLLLAVAACLPLRALPDANRLLESRQPGPVEEVLRQQLREPLEEERLREGIPSLTPITSAVSTSVREQYEQNPYPRWVGMALREEPLPFNAELRRTLPMAHFEPLPDDGSPQVLVAGCGTGSDAISAARRFRGARVLAVDLSLASLGYAMRKTRELAVANVDYAQADILEIGRLARVFDVITAIGVLHHLADPFAGWKSLLGRLRPGGFMSLGLYSQIARAPVARARELIAARGYKSTAEDIRRFRQEALAAETGAEVRSLSRSLAFYSMSDCRDLAFHAQEQHLTLPRIGSFLGESGLRFLGFELDPRVLQQYRDRYREDPAGTDLANWAAFEAENPDTFTGMYRFWIQR